MTRGRNARSFYQALAEGYLRECDELLEYCEMINDYLECLYDNKPKPSEEWDGEYEYV